MGDATTYTDRDGGVCLREDGSLSMGANVIIVYQIVVIALNKIMMGVCRGFNV
jgi:hypothetical protein